MRNREIPIGSDIERLYSTARVKRAGGCHNLNMTERNREDCLDAIETLKHVHPSSVPLIYRIVALFLAIPYWKGKMFHGKAKMEESRHA